MSRFGKFKVGTKKTTSTNYVGGTTEKRRGNATASRKTTPYVMRNLELKLEERMRDKRKFDNWKRRQEQKLKKNTEVLDVSEFLRKKVSMGPKKKKKLINIQGKSSYKLTSEPVGKTGIPVMQDCSGIRFLFSHV